MNQENPYRPPEGAIQEEIPSNDLSDLKIKELKKLRNDSTNVGCLGLLWSFTGLGMLFTGIVIAVGEKDIPAGLGIIGISSIPLAGTFAAWNRPVWGRFYGFFLCFILMLNIISLLTGKPSGLLGFIIGLMGGFSFWRGKRLFGPNKLTHAQVKQAYKAKTLELKR